MGDFERIAVESSSEDIGLRADVFLTSALDMSRSAVQKLIEEGCVFRALRNGREERVVKKDLVQANECYLCDLPEVQPYHVLPENIPLDICFEDQDVIVVNKPKGMVVHPAPGHETGTLVSALLYHCKDSLSGIGGEMRPGIVHRIDKDTTGLIAVAKNDFAHASLASQLSDHSMFREYEAIICGKMKETKGTISAPIGRCPNDRKKMAVVTLGHARSAVTHYEVIREYDGFSHIRCILETGRTHQIRVHMSFKGHPILGDELYGGNNTPFVKKHADWIHGQCLHARKLTFYHPRTGERITVESPLPDDFTKILVFLKGTMKDDQDETNF